MGADEWLFVFLPFHHHGVKANGHVTSESMWQENEGQENESQFLNTDWR